MWKDPSRDRRILTVAFAAVFYFTKETAMKKKSIINLSISAAALIAVVILAITMRSTEMAENPYYGSFMALVPPLIAIGLALMTKEVYSSLFVGVLAAALFFADFNPFKNIPYVYVLCALFMQAITKMYSCFFAIILAICEK